MAHLAYFDESVDEKFFVLAGVLMHESVWRQNLDTVLELRRRARRRFGVPVTAELKATHIRRGEGPMEALKWDIYRRAQLLNMLLRWQARHLQVNVFAVAIDKAKLGEDGDSRSCAWKYALERADTFCRKIGSTAVLFPDSGHGYFIRKMVRKLRRHHLITGRYGGTLKKPFKHIVEDPSERLSHESLLIQLADWNAFAALRSRYIAPLIPEFATAWDELGSSLVLDVNKLTPPPHPPGIVVYPR